MNDKDAQAYDNSEDKEGNIGGSLIDHFSGEQVDNVSYPEEEIADHEGVHPNVLHFNQRQRNERTEACPQNDNDSNEEEHSLQQGYETRKLDQDRRYNTENIENFNDLNTVCFEPILNEGSKVAKQGSRQISCQSYPGTFTLSQVLTVKDDPE